MNRLDPSKTSAGPWLGLALVSFGVWAAFSFAVRHAAATLHAAVETLLR